MDNNNKKKTNYDDLPEHEQWKIPILEALDEWLEENPGKTANDFFNVDCIPDTWI